MQTRRASGQNAEVSGPASLPSNRITANATEGQTYYIHADHLDTPRQITDTQGNVVWQWDNTDPFGNNMPNDNPNGAGQFSFNLRFPGQYADRETNTYYNVNRDYDPALGRYVESDPIGLMGGINTFAYVGGNPLKYVDPTGQSALGAAAIGVLTFVTGYGLYDSYQASKQDSCDCKDKIGKAQKILQALRQKFPSRYKKDLSVGVRDIPIGGVTYITNGGKIVSEPRTTVCSAHHFAG
ncbi:MAG: RHS domain-containing protein [Gallionella sp.]|nr:RHS domain-containing protein [Gallionella sp.]MDD4947494.1 RHS domain-containing protein [Gallionella sp.]